MHKIKLFRQISLIGITGGSWPTLELSFLFFNMYRQPGNYHSEIRAYWDPALFMQQTDIEYAQLEYALSKDF